MQEKQIRSGSIAGWWVYLLRLKDNSLYCGITNDPERRLKQHNQGTASRYTRTRLPAQMVFKAPCPDRPAALKLEKQIKGLKKIQKEIMVKSGRLPTFLSEAK
ncbi:GIY-YIG nuclease family protein [Dethiosulfatarculus sandiegensis]|nr:GIY-YIG nuclease family protein [Dethiosulfatarculus sandiegensis]